MEKLHIYAVGRMIRSLLCALAVAAPAWYKLSESMPMDGGAALVPLLLGIAVGMLVHYIGEGHCGEQR